MISCSSFRKKLKDYIESAISLDFKREMDSHMEECIECRALYEEEIRVDNMFLEALSGKNLEFNSSRSQILEGIDTNKYKKSFRNKLYFNMKKNYVRYLSSAAALILIFFAGLFLRGLNSNRFNLGNPPIVHEKTTYSNFADPDSIVINTYGGKRTLTKDDPSYKRILDLTEARFVKPMSTSNIVVDEDTLKELETELYIEFLYNSSESTDYKGFKDQTIKAEYSRLLMPLTGNMSGYLITGDKDKYQSGPIGSLASSEELAQLLLADEVNKGLTGLDLPVVDFSLTPELTSIYKQYSKKKDDNLLKGYEPIDICKLYLYAWEKEDYETEYALYIKEENYGTPSYDQYVKDINHDPGIKENTKAFIKNLKGNSISIKQSINDNNAMVVFKFKDREFMGGEISFGLVKSSKGIWKANWMPFQ